MFVIRWRIIGLLITFLLYAAVFCSSVFGASESDVITVGLVEDMGSTKRYSRIAGGESIKAFFAGSDVKIDLRLEPSFPRLLNALSANAIDVVVVAYAPDLQKPQELTDYTVHPRGLLQTTSYYYALPDANISFIDSVLPQQVRLGMVNLDPEIAGVVVNRDGPCIYRFLRGSQCAL